MAKRKRLPPWHRSYWESDLALAAPVLARHGCALEDVTADYQTARIVGDGVRLVIYPHRTSAGNYHLRLRDEGSAKPMAAIHVAKALDKAAGYNCTFSMHMDAISRLAQRATLSASDNQPGDNSA